MRKFTALCLICILALIMAGCSENNIDNGNQTTDDTILSFSYEEDKTIYKNDYPGVNSNSFVNVDSIPINSQNDAIEQAKKECTVNYDTIEVWYDSTTEIWKVHFSTKNTVGGDQTVYMGNDGITCLIVYGE